MRLVAASSKIMFPNFQLISCEVNVDTMNTILLRFTSLSAPRSLLSKRAHVSVTEHFYTQKEASHYKQKQHNRHSMSLLYFFNIISVVVKNIIG